MADILIPTPLRKFSGDNARVAVTAGTVKDAIRDLARQFPELSRYLFTEEDNLQNYLRVYLGEQDIRELKGADTEVQEQDVISIIPAIAGGKN